jgi:DNA repair exonuclease SbcCD ATPase subunit
LYSKASQELRGYQTSKQRIEVKVSDLNALTSCPHCLQKVTDGHKHSISTKSVDKLLELEAQIQAQQEIVDELRTKSEAYQATQQELSSLTPTINYTKKDKFRFDEQLVSLQAKLNSAKTSTSSIDVEKDKLRECAAEGKKLVEALSELEKKRAIQELSVLLLKDSGIKARIVKDYLPVLNGLINHYLTGYEFEINFTLDENFNESVQSRGRESFTYHSFSEGEKEKIDYAIMLALRQIAASKNAAHINILVLDEVLDGSLDEESRSATLQMLASDVEQSNIFVISHTESNPGHYDTIIKVDKKGDFSFLQEVT